MRTILSLILLILLLDGCATANKMPAYDTEDWEHWCARNNYITNNPTSCLFYSNKIYDYVRCRVDNLKRKRIPAHTGISSEYRCKHTKGCYVERVTQLTGKCVCYDIYEIEDDSSNCSVPEPYNYAEIMQNIDNNYRRVMTEGFYSILEMDPSVKGQYISRQQEMLKSIYPTKDDGYMRRMVFLDALRERFCTPDYVLKLTDQRYAAVCKKVFEYSEDNLNYNSVSAEYVDTMKIRKKRYLDCTNGSWSCLNLHKRVEMLLDVDLQ